MPILLWDASALTKRYAPEAGSDTVDALFTTGQAIRSVATVLRYAETYAALVRKHNRGDISASAFATAKSSLRNELIPAPTFVLLTVDDAAIFDGLTHVETHNLNEADAAILTLFLRYAHVLPLGSPPCLVVASDQRLLQAAQAEGLPTLNPEVVPAAGVPAFLAAP